MNSRTIDASLLNCFRQAPPSVIPAVLDCILASTNSSPCLLLSSLLNEFPNFIKEIKEGSENIDQGRIGGVGSYVSAVCHLLKKSGAAVNDLEVFIWTVLIPTLKWAHGSHLQVFNEVVSLFVDVLGENSCWNAVEGTLFPFIFRLIGLSMGLIQSGESAIYEWTSSLNLELCDNNSAYVTSLRHFDGKLTVAVRRDPSLSQSGFFPLSVSCYVLAKILDTLVQYKNTSCGSGLENGCHLETLTGNLLWDLCNLIFQMLSQSAEHRSSAVRILLPSIFDALSSNTTFEVFVHDKRHVLSRELLVNNLWSSCKKLFSLGLSERRDAYAILSLYVSASSLSSESKDGNMNSNRTISDFTAYDEFWEELKRGLVDKENVVRKLSLHILKRILNISQENKSSHEVSEVESDENTLEPHALTKRERWANKEATSLGVGKIHKFTEHNNQETWEAFILLYEMLEEYGTHLVEAAWNHQMNLLVHSFPAPENDPANSSCGELPRTLMRTFTDVCGWLAVLWERGFSHDNPNVRCLIMQSFLVIEWRNYGNCAKLVPDEFILGALMKGLNDPVHHKEFGVKGVYSSWTIGAASNFFLHYGSSLDIRSQTKFLCRLVKLSMQYSFGRPGLMCLAECIASAAHGIQISGSFIVKQFSHVNLPLEKSAQNETTRLLDSLRFIIDSTKQHFNAKYRFQVCEKMLDAAASVVSAVDVPLVNILYFVSNMPREFTDIGPLRLKIQKWLMNEENHFNSNCSSQNLGFLETLIDFPRNFVCLHHHFNANTTYDDDDIDLWQTEADRWARVIFLVTEDRYLETILSFITDYGSKIVIENNQLKWISVKFLILVSSLVLELQVIQRRLVEDPFPISRKTEPVFERHYNLLKHVTFLNFGKSLLSISDVLVSFAEVSCSIWWSSTVEAENNIPNAVKGRLGGPSQRRLLSFMTTKVLQAIESVKCVASVSRWCAHVTPDNSLDSVTTFLWEFCWKIIKSPVARSEAKAEICLAGYEALAHVLNATMPAFSSLSLRVIIDEEKLSLFSSVKSEQALDLFVLTFLKNVNDLISSGELVRTRRAVLMKWKWSCLECILCIPKIACKNGVLLTKSDYFLSGNTIKLIFNDLVESLENAGEASVIPILRSVRLMMELFASGKLGRVVSSCGGINTQMMWNLVKPCWILHISCVKRRVAPIAALLSTVLHPSVFNDIEMHEFEGVLGPLKWFIVKILDVGSKSPRTTRLAALHLTGLWLKYPTTIKFYMNELKFLTMYGSVAFDEDFEAELSENQEAKSEIAVLARSPNPELTAEFINSELYARVCVATLFYKLAEPDNVDENRNASLLSGKMFLLELLQFALSDKDLTRELYKKYSAIHRRKIRVWQMICVLARFVDQEIVDTVTSLLHKALQTCNLSSVRQYLETFSIYIYLKFPLLVGKDLVILLRNYDIRPQALSSYVYIAANVIMHADQPIKNSHLNELLPPIIPLLTSHHHTLRGFTQLLVYQILHKFSPSLDSDALSLPKKCLDDLKSYLTCNPDCVKLRSSMEGYLDAFDPIKSVTPGGIFTNRVEELDFECAPKNLMDQVITFLNDARGGLRDSMAKDVATIRNHDLETGVQQQPSLIQNGVMSNFQKKFTLCKYDMQTSGQFLMDGKDSLESLAGIEKEDELLDVLLHSRISELQKLRGNRQQFVLVASFIDRIPNLAGLARTCEVFRTAGLAIADKSISKDKQFQLISVTADKWVPLIEVPVSSVKVFLEKKKQEGFAILGLEQTANSISLDQYVFPTKTVLVLGKEKEGIPVEIIHVLDACIEIPQLGVVRSLNVHVSGAIAMWEYTRQQRSR